MRPIARRLENWGNIGLLTPVGERHTGRGRARAYDEHEQIKAAVMLLAFAFQTPSAVLEMVADLFDDIRSVSPAIRRGRVRTRSQATLKILQQGATLLEQAKAGKGAYLTLKSAGSDGRITARFRDNLDHLKQEESAVVVNVTRAIKRLN